jgi:hypothetical protein
MGRDREAKMFEVRTPKFKPNGEPYKRGTEHGVLAHDFRVHSGVLVFRSKYGKNLRAYAPGAWSEVWEDGNSSRSSGSGSGSGSLSASNS